MLRLLKTAAILALLSPITLFNAYSYPVLPDTAPIPSFRDDPSIASGKLARIKKVEPPKIGLLNAQQGIWHLGANIYCYNINKKRISLRTGVVRVKSKNITIQIDNRDVRYSTDGNYYLCTRGWGSIEKRNPVVRMYVPQKQA